MNAAMPPRRGIQHAPAPGPSRGIRSRAPRTGLLGWWVDLTAPPRPADWASLPAGPSERLRKAELTSYSILAVALFLLALFVNTLADPGTLSAVALMAVFLLVTAVLNRLGLTRAAAVVIPSALTLLTMLAVLSAPGGLRLIVLPAYDLFVIPIFIASLIGEWWWAGIFATIACAFIIGDYSLQPHALVTATGVDLTRAQGFDELAREAKIFTGLGMVNRDIAVNLFAALFASLGAFSVERAIVRASRAEQVAAIERARAAERQELEQGVEMLRQTHVRLANGDYAARVPALPRDNILWQVAASLNNLVARLQSNSRAEFELRRTQEEMQRLLGALDDARMGRAPVWPGRTGTMVDAVVDRLANRSADVGRGDRAPSQVPPQPPQYRHPGQSSQGGAPNDLSGWPTNGESGTPGRGGW